MPRARPLLTEQMRARLAALSDPGPPSMRTTDDLPAPQEISDSSTPVEDGSDGGLGPRSTVRTFTRIHLLVVAVVVTIAVGVAAWMMLRARDHPVDTEVQVTVTSPSPTTGPATEQETPTPEPARIAIHVVGEVADPGVVELDDGARVADAVAAAGGFTERAVPGRLNLAQRLHDGEQVFISDAADPPSEVISGSGEPPGRDTPPEAGGLVNLNTATAEQLETLPGVGPATAQAILAWRETNGRFSSVEELQEVDGIGPKTFARLKPLVTI